MDNARQRERKERLLNTLLTDLFISYRNALRHRRRSLAGAMAVTFGTVALMLAAGFIEYIYWAMREGTIHAGMGHIQVIRAGYAERGMADPFEYVLADDIGARKVIENAPHVVQVASRLRFTGLLALRDASLSFLGEGRDPDHEVGGADSLIVESGAPLSSAMPTGVLLGRGLAANLGAKVGDSVVLLVNKRGGALDGMDVTVRGIFSTQTKAYDDVALQLPFSLARQLLQSGGAHSWIVYLDQTRNTDAVVRDLRPKLTNDLALVPWYQTADFYNKTVRLFSRQVLVMKIIIAIVVILSISNTMMMNVMERTDEIATSMAVGVRRRNILIRFLFEGVFIGLLGALAGLLIGYVLAELISRVGIPMPPPPGMARGYLGKILLTPVLVRDALIIAIVTSVIASLYPAWKASRMVIADALRHGR